MGRDGSHPGPQTSPDLIKELLNPSPRSLKAATCAESNLLHRVQRVRRRYGAIARNRLKRLFIGATAERTLQDLPCDLLIVNPDWYYAPIETDEVDTDHR
jgi:hypothetical protein